MSSIYAHHGHLYVANPDKGVVRVFDTRTEPGSLTLIRTLGDRTNWDGTDRDHVPPASHHARYKTLYGDACSFSLPTDVCVANGRVYVLDKDNKRIQVFLVPNETFVAKLPAPGTFYRHVKEDGTVKDPSHMPPMRRIVHEKGYNWNG